MAYNKQRHYNQVVYNKQEQEEIMEVEVEISFKVKLPVSIDCDLKDQRNIMLLHTHAENLLRDVMTRSKLQEIIERNKTYLEKIYDKKSYVVDFNINLVR